MSDSYWLRAKNLYTRIFNLQRFAHFYRTRLARQREPIPTSKLEDERPIFLFGQPRSGSTLLQRMLNSTGQALIYGEHLGLLKGVAQSYDELFREPGLGGHYDRSPGTRVPPKLIELYLRDPYEWPAKTSGLHVDMARGAYRDFIYSISNPCRSGLRWGFKEIRYGCKDAVAPMLHELFPLAKFILLVRHPMGQIASVLRTGWWKEWSLDDCIANWLAQARSFVRLREAMPESAYLIRYEDLIEESGRSPQELFRWLGLPFGTGPIQALRRKVGQTADGHALPEDVRQKILEGCLLPEFGALYGGRD